MLALHKERDCTKKATSRSVGFLLRKQKWWEQMSQLLKNNYENKIFISSLFNRDSRLCQKSIKTDVS